MQRNIALDCLKLLLALMVVGLHCHFLADVSPLAEYLTVNGLFRVAVPIFLLINGFYFYPVLTNGKAQFWFKRVLILYLFWMLFYAYYWFTPSSFSLVEIAKIVAKIIIGYHHLWYISGMLGAAAVLLFFKQSGVKRLTLLLLTTFFVGVAIQYVGNYHLVDNTLLDRVSNYNWIHRNFLFFSFPFFCLGFLINKLELHKIFNTKHAVALSIIGLVLLIFESYLNFISPSRDGAFDNYAALIVLCPGVFLLVMKMNIISENKQIASYSSAIFFIHSLILSVFREHTAMGATMLTFAVIAVSVLASFVLIKINNKLKFIL